MGETLVRLGYCTEEAMRQALCLQVNVPYVNLDNLIIDPGLVELPKRHRLVPIARMADTLTIAMNDPTDAECADEFAQSSGCSIQVVTSSLASIVTAIARLYDSAPEEEHLETIEVVTDQPVDPAVRSEYQPESRRADGPSSPASRCSPSSTSPSDAGPRTAASACGSTAPPSAPTTTSGRPWSRATTAKASWCAFWTGDGPPRRSSSWARAVSTVTRLLDLKVDPTLISSSLIGVLSQRLVRKICPVCRQSYEPSAELMREFFDHRPSGFEWTRAERRAHDLLGRGIRAVPAEQSRAG